MNSAVHLNVTVTRLDQAHFLRNTQSILQKTKRILVKEISDWMLKSLNKIVYVRSKIISIARTGYFKRMR